MGDDLEEMEGLPAGEDYEACKAADEWDNRREKQTCAWKQRA